MNKWEEIGFVIKSKNRLHVLELLNEKVQNPSNIAKKLDNHRSSISKVIGELLNKELVECLTPNDKTFRLYQITTKGQDLLKKSKELIDE